MSKKEKPMSYMQQLDQWSSSTIIKPLLDAFNQEDGPDSIVVIEQAKKTIREKVLESYRNGQKAGQPKASNFTYTKTSKPKIV